MATVAAPEALWARARADHGDRAIHRIELRSVGDRLAYVVRGDDLVARYDGATGEPLPVTRDEAAVIGSRDQDGAPIASSVSRVEDAAPIEYRDRPLPAWRVVLADDERTVVWVDARSGDVTARRTDSWRAYDFLWSLHIMDYRARDDFRHPLIVAFAILANLTAISGLVLWITRWARRLRRDARSSRAEQSRPRAG